MYYKKMSSANTKLLKLFLRAVQIFNDLETDLGQYLHKQKRSGRRCSYKISSKKMASNTCSLTWTKELSSPQIFKLI